MLPHTSVAHREKCKALSKVGSSPKHDGHLQVIVS